MQADISRYVITNPGCASAEKQARSSTHWDEAPTLSDRLVASTRRGYSSRNTFHLHNDTDERECQSNVLCVHPFLGAPACISLMMGDSLRAVATAQHARHKTHRLYYSRALPPKLPFWQVHNTFPLIRNSRSEWPLYQAACGPCWCAIV